MSFQKFIKNKILSEGLWDPKRQNLYEPDDGQRYDDGEDDDWRPIYGRSGMNSEYPKAKLDTDATGKPKLDRGMSLKSPRDLFSTDVTKDNMSDDDLYKTLQGKMHANEPLTKNEKMWLAMLGRKSARQIVKHGIHNAELSDNPMD